MHDYGALAHIPWAVGLQLIGIGLLRLAGRITPAHVWICGLGGLAPMIAREITQAEYRYIEAHGGRRALMPDLAGFRVWDWNRHSIEETLYAAAAVATVAIAAGWFLRK